MKFGRALVLQWAKDNADDLHCFVHMMKDLFEKYTDAFPEEVLFSDRETIQQACKRMWQS